MTKYNKFSKIENNNNIDVYKNKMLDKILKESNTKSTTYQATHHSMNKTKGSYNISKDDIDWIFDNDINPNIGLLEVPKHYSMLRVDLDFKSDNLDETKDMELITLNAVRQFNKFLDENEEGNMDKTSFILSKPPYVKQEKDKQIKKFGVHIQYPKIFLSKDDFKRFEDYFKDKIEGFDCIATKNWLIYGQQKNEDSGFYKLDYVLDEYLNRKTETDLKSWYWNMYKLDGKKICIDNPPLKKILSINHNTDPEYCVGFEIKIKIDDELVKESKKIEQKKEYNTEDKVEIVNLLMPLLSDKRAENRDDWMKILFLLKNILDNDEGKNIWLEFSKRSEKFYENECVNLWEKTKILSERCVGLGSLYHWARSDNPKLYKHVLRDIMQITHKKSLEDTLEGSHYDVAKLFNEVYGYDDVRITSQKDLTNFIWNVKEKLWKESGKETLCKIISDNLTPMYVKVCIDLIKKIAECDKCDKGTEAMLNAKLKRAQKMVNNLKSVPYINNIAKALGGYDIDKDFETEVMNKSKHELPIKDCKIINLKTLEVRGRVKEDYWSFECPVSFLGEEADLSPVTKFFSDISCGSEDLMDYHRRMWGYLMTGEISDRSLHIFWGDGCNGKSSIVNVLGNIMGKFKCSLDEDVMIKKTSRGASPELMDLLTARLGCLPESDKREEINSKRIKTITGDDTISARHLFGHSVKFKTQCKPVWATNHKPKINVEDKAILDRLKLVPFLARFEKNSENTKYIHNLQENKLDEFFTWFCTGAKDWYGGAELIPCSEMKVEMDKYISENDAIGEFLMDVYDTISKGEYSALSVLEKDSWRIKKSFVYGEFCCWIQDNQRKEDMIGKKEFNKLVDKKLDSIQTKGVRCYICRKKEPEENNDDDNCYLPPM
jgi:P4 family phage/plasmid primase-like protien